MPPRGLPSGFCQKSSQSMMGEFLATSQGTPKGLSGRLCEVLIKGLPGGHHEIS